MKSLACRRILMGVLLAELLALCGCGNAQDARPDNPSPLPGASEHQKLPKTRTKQAK